MSAFSMTRRAMFGGAIAAACWPVAAAAGPADSTLDFEELYPRLREAHFDLYARRSRPEYDKAFAKMRRSFEQALSTDEIVLEVQRFLALARIAHTYSPGFWGMLDRRVERGGVQFPLDVRIRAGKPYVFATREVEGVVAGDEILAINGVTAPALLPKLRAWISADNDYLLDTLLEQSFALTLFFLMPTAERFELKLARGGRRISVAVPALDGTTMQARIKAASSAATSRQGRDWHMLDKRVGYLRPGPFYNPVSDPQAMYDNTGFARFIDAAFEGLSTAGCRKLIIDVRDNPGGDSSFSDLMVSWIADRPFRFASDFRIKVSREATASNAARIPAGDTTSPSYRLGVEYAKRKPGDVFSYDIPTSQPREGRRFTGQCFVLVNRYSYSNAVNVAALMQDYNFARVVGEETADLATSFGAMEEFKLSRTGVRVGFPKALIIRPNGSLAPRGVIPDIAVTSPLLENGGDPVLDDVVARATR